MQKQLLRFAYGKKVSETRILQFDSTLYSKSNVIFLTLWYSIHSLEKPKAIKHVVNCNKVARKKTSKFRKSNNVKGQNI